MRDDLGSVCVVLHSHLPWLAHAGTWPVGEEWLHQAWTRSYVPLVALLRRLADEGRRDVLTLGVTPVLAAMLDDPWCLDEVREWTGARGLRASGLATDPDAHLREVGAAEHRATAATLAELEGPWRAGASPLLRGLADAGVVELLGGPLTHPVLPLVDPRVAAAQLDAGLDDARHRWGGAPAGIWAPECAYRPGLEDLYAALGVQRLMVDGPTALHAGGPETAWPRTADLWTLGDSDVVVAARDLDVTYRVWSPTAGYPGGPWYRDFHTFHHWSGLHPSRVTDPGVPPEHKAPYDPDAARAAVSRDADDFVGVVLTRLRALRDARDGRPGVVVVAYDTELFGHWWHEGPLWLEEVLRRLPDAGVHLTTLGGALERHGTAGALHPHESSWGRGKDLSVWAGEQVAPLRHESDALQAEALEALDRTAGDPAVRDPVRDQLVRELFLTTSSDWPFGVSHGSAPDYLAGRQHTHAARTRELAAALSGDRGAAGRRAAELRALDGVGPWVDARRV